MSKLAQLCADIVKLWGKYGTSYIKGIENTLVLALIGTLLGCLIGFVCGVLNTIPCGPTVHPVKRFFLKLIRVVIRIYVEVFRGTPMVLQAVFLYYGLPYFTNNALKFTSVWVAAIVVVSINTGFREYKTWERKGDLLILTGVTTGYSNEKFVDTNNIISLDEEHLVIGQDGYTVTYVRK